MRFPLPTLISTSHWMTSSLRRVASVRHLSHRTVHTLPVPEVTQCQVPRRQPAKAR
ncbi:hypothetical protein SNOG_07166 [Parastagonospora nodorum SN15]|uniref:Uncharacterized protein n=1 Tax=Phaeosphaeria nodorum (strain SN15 / ATCC MYA-4574 / FGSC 10173) TaxID=321614 RepID=Q0UM48_PHANO|nr:hypothetical protein SNOG_07166 [Parastagonospora nodorum SN15]EAT85817.2 hypothetical protein SNOG_07166 [Parastagonospora nodorum SN15]